MKRNIRIVFVLILFSACTNIRKSTLSTITRESYCSPPAITDAWLTSLSLNTDSILSVHSQLKQRYTDQTVLMLYAMDICDAIGDTVRTLNYQRINSAVWLANSEIDALAAELDCEGERIAQIASYVDNINSNRAKKFTVASILVGAAAGIASAFIENKDWNKGVAIGAGTIAAGLGFATLNPAGKKVRLTHKRNLLRDIWQASNRDSIPPFIWFTLNEKRFTNAGASSLLANTRQRWIDYQFNGNVIKAAASINFSDGGIYRAADLHYRSQMINQLQAVIRSIKQQLNAMLLELKRSGS